MTKRTEQDRVNGLEWPTIALAVLIYGGWLALTRWHAQFPPLLVAAAGGWLIAWHNSLQHETIHGHPTGRSWVDGAIGFAPIALWLPYTIYRRNHRAHHQSAAITDPFDDPESRYLGPDRGWKGFANRVLEGAQSSLLGRLILGPMIVILRFLGTETQRAAATPKAVLADWGPHLLAVTLVLLWLHHCALGVGNYVLLFVYPGMALSLLRSFAEHRAAPSPGHRVAIVETRSPLGLLFLHNNLHAAHHHKPALPWYRLPAYHRRNRDHLLQANGGLLYGGYGDVLRRFAFRAHDRLTHPDHDDRRPARQDIS